MKKFVPLIPLLIGSLTITFTACSQPEQQKTEKTTSETTPSSSEVTANTPDFRLGLDGKYHQSGLAKRVSQALAEDPEVARIPSIHIAQRKSTIVLKGKVPNQAALNKIVNIAQDVNGVTRVETDQVQIK